MKRFEFDVTTTHQHCFVPCVLHLEISSYSVAHKGTCAFSVSVPSLPSLTATPSSYGTVVLSSGSDYIRYVLPSVSLPRHMTIPTECAVI